MRETRDGIGFDNPRLDDRYAFRQMLGRGGMGVVIKAHDRLLDRPVAIKRLDDQLAELEEAHELFLTEARNLAGLNHPNLVAVHDVVDGRRPMLITEFVDGEDLQNCSQRLGRLPRRTVLKLGLQLARATAYLHDEGLLHRDLKPANLMITAEKKLKVIDFGLSRSLERLAVRQTRRRGSPAYMAPEQILGHDLSPATDIYQIGVTLFELLVGRLPFPGQSPAWDHVHEAPPRLSEVAPDVDTELAELVDRCLSKAPEERPADGHALSARLGALCGVARDDTISEVSLGPPPTAEAPVQPTNPEPPEPLVPGISQPNTASETHERASVDEASADRARSGVEKPDEKASAEDAADKPARLRPRLLFGAALAAATVLIGGSAYPGDPTEEPIQQAQHLQRSATFRTVELDGPLAEPSPRRPAETPEHNSIAVERAALDVKLAVSRALGSSSTARPIPRTIPTPSSPKAASQNPEPSDTAPPSPPEPASKPEPQPETPANPANHAPDTPPATPDPEPSSIFSDPFPTTELPTPPPAPKPSTRPSPQTDEQPPDDAPKAPSNKAPWVPTSF